MVTVGYGLVGELCRFHFPQGQTAEIFFFFVNRIQTDPGARRCLHPIGTWGLFLMGVSGQGMELTAHFHRMSKLRRLHSYL
jgi:hypothetical protein